ncbi:DNA integrity scanning protein DisA with diadenylate cyclase activity [Methanomicrobium sp. W14]|uniref:DNA integrity scanning protein DisA nucleotide-binding domain protein n=1 Tax=Methanomicrobium sp. W14 TaxID=2817839 RepID=UPI001AE4C94F|nr:diadenylate cyclase [Methanomicrobium sp. W14]MBP2133206.1 DNA integrity scanning protein DisA with diadenylate cyclase activity [Methanomicrobium sp. W14]
MMQKASEIAVSIGAKAIVSFIKPFSFKSDIPLLWVEDLQLDVLKDLTMHDILEISEKHLNDAAVQIYLCKNYEEGQVVGVFPYAILIYDIRDGPGFINVKDYDGIANRDVVSAVLRLALDIAVEGREGRKVGTAFIIGNPDDIMKNSHQAIINPYKGQHPDDCDIKNEHNWESIKEFSQLDGVFVVDNEGKIVAAGRYLNINTGSINLPGGMGGRHLAAAAITLDLPVIGITVSESGGVVRVFHGGKCVQTIRSDLRIRW